MHTNKEKTKAGTKNMPMKGKKSAAVAMTKALDKKKC